MRMVPGRVFFECELRIWVLLRVFREETRILLPKMSLRAGGFDRSVKSLSFFNSFMKTFNDNIFRIVNFVNISFNRYSLF